MPGIVINPPAPRPSPGPQFSPAQRLAQARALVYQQMVAASLIRQYAWQTQFSQFFWNGALVQTSQSLQWQRVGNRVVLAETDWVQVGRQYAWQTTLATQTGMWRTWNTGVWF